MVKNTAITKVFTGEMVRATTWDKDKYIVVNKDGQTVDNNGKPFNIVTAKEKKWEVYVKPAPVMGNSDNTELVEMIKNLTGQVSELTGQVSDLQETIRTKEDNVTVEQTVDSYEIADEVSQAVETKVEQALKDNIPQEEKTHEETVKIFYGVSTLKEVREMFKTDLLNCNEKKDVALTVTKYIPYCWMGGRKINTVKRYYTDLRNVIKDVNDQYQEFALELFSIPSDVYERLSEADKKKVLEKLDNKETFDVSQIQNTMDELKDYIKIAQNLGEAATAEDLKGAGIPIAKQQKPSQARAYLYASYLALATGRRNTEILKSLELVKKRNVWYYKGLTKKGLPDMEVKAVALDEDFDFLKGLISQIRKDVDTTKLSNQEVNSKYNHVFNRSFKRITGLNYTFHDAREIYAEMAYLKLGNKKGTEREEQDFKADILGHEIDKDRLIATDHYRTKQGK